MALKILPKHLHPDFINPKRKPTGPFVLDLSNPYAKRMQMFAVAVPGGLYEVVTGKFLPASAGTYTIVDGEGALYYTGTETDTLQLGYYIPITYSGTELTAGARGCRGTRIGSGSPTLAQLGTGGAANADDGFLFGVVQKFNSNPTYDLQVNATGGFSSIFMQTTGEPGADFVLSNLSGSAYWDSGDTPQMEAHAYLDGSQFGTGNRTLGGTADGIDQITIDALGENMYLSMCWVAEGYWTPEEHREFNENIWQVLKPAVPIPTFTPAAAGAATLEQAGFRFRNDDGSEALATWRQNQDVNDTVNQEETFRLRFLIQGVNDPAASQFQLEYKDAGDPDSEYKVIE